MISQQWMERGKGESYHMKTIFKVREREGGAIRLCVLKEMEQSNKYIIYRIRDE